MLRQPCVGGDLLMLTLDAIRARAYLKVAGRGVAAVLQTVRQPPGRSWRVLPGTYFENEIRTSFPVSSARDRHIPAKTVEEVWKKLALARGDC